MAALKSVGLPPYPKEKEYEEYISAYLQASGYYVERNIVERDVEEVLELDVFLTEYLPPKNRQILVEIKSGKNWGFPEIFKISGWLKYLGYTDALLVATESKGRPQTDEFYAKKSAQIGVDLAIITQLTDTPLKLVSYLRGKSLHTVDVATWRFAYWIERRTIDRLVKLRKSVQNVHRYEAMFRYYNTLNNSVFFTSNILERIRQLFRNFQANANLSAKVATEIETGLFEGDQIPKSLFADTYYNCTLNDLAISSYLEYKSRLTILKYVTDFLLIREADPHDTRISDNIDFLGTRLSRIDFLPADFRDRVETLANCPSYHIYPVLWQ